MEADPFEQGDGCGVAGQHGGLDAVESHLLEPMPQDGGDCLGHQALAPVAACKVIADDGEVIVLVPPRVAARSDDLRAAVRQQAPPQRLALPELASSLGCERMALVNAGERVPGVVLSHPAVAEDVEQPRAVRLSDLTQDQPGCSQHHRVAEHDPIVTRKGHYPATRRRRTAGRLRTATTALGPRDNRPEACGRELATTDSSGAGRPRTKCSF